MSTPELTNSVGTAPQSATNLGVYADTLVAGFRYAWYNPASSSYFACSMGFTVAGQGGAVGFLSASHCSPVKWGYDGTSFLQPTAGPSIGAEWNDMAPGTCPWFWPCNHYRYSDANINVVTGRPVKVGYIAQPNTRGNQISGDTTLASNSYLQVVGQTASITQGSTMDQIGATSGWKYGEVINTCSSFYSSNGLVRCTYTTHAKSEGGDSGGPVFYYSSGTATATGIVFAKTSYIDIGDVTFFSKFMYVYNETAGVAGAYSILPATPPPVYAPTATIVGTDTMQPNASCYFFVTSSLSYTTVSWTVSGVEVGTNYDLYYSAGSSFLLEVQVTDGTNAAFASKTVTVSSDASTCYIQ